eukprot:s295_g3.t1
MGNGDLNGLRIGEASHPGPPDLLTIGSTNPSGLRGKELLAIDQGGGIWHYAESQLSSVTQASAAKSLKYHAGQVGRHVRVHHSAPAALRSRSTWAGAWSGITCTSDFPSKRLQVDWPPDVWSSGRVLATQHFLGSHIITIVGIYGLPRGPTWPRAAALTDEILTFVTKEFVLGYHGIVLILGDFNFSPHELPSFDAWRAYGFCSAQEFAHRQWHQPILPTCKRATERDLVWLSPMTAALCSEVSVQEVFQDHATVSVKLNLEASPTSIQTWPKPREIPWEQVRIDEWQSRCATVHVPFSEDATATMNCSPTSTPSKLVKCMHLRSNIALSSGRQYEDPKGLDLQDFALTLGSLPVVPPNVECTSLIYQAFHHQFRSFEQWHLAQRQLVLQAKYDKTMKALFQDLRKPSPDQVDSFWETTPYEVVAIKHDTDAVLLNRHTSDTKEGQWFLHGRPLRVRGQLAEMLLFDPMPDLAVGDVLDFHYHTAHIGEVHQCLIDFWQPRWNCQAPLYDAVWQRVLNFAAHLLPRLPLQLPDLTIADWRRTVRRFKPRAARGADGWAKLDLLHMPDAYVACLLQLLTNIEQGACPWPAQLLEGLVIAIAKCEGAHRPNEFRPIVLLSIVYRCWASLRSRQLLRMLEPYIHSDAHGFLPSPEPAQTWLLIQAAVETSLQSSMPLAGLGTDLIKAFNSIRREPLWILAEAIGVPASLLRPWKSFTSSFTRRFMVCNQVSSALTSNLGFAEGCPLSVCAMAMVDWGFHLYQYHYSPGVRHLSFVDNISMLAREARFVAWAFFTLKTYLTMWGLALDMTKTYAWGTTPQARHQLAQLGIKIVTDFSELGGALTFTAAHRAIKSLSLQLAGSNPMLRLSLGHPITADPGFFQLRTATFDFRRLCAKSPDLLAYWRIFMTRYDGVLRDGPLAKLLTLFGSIGWRVLQPPCIADHDGFIFDLFAISKGALEILLVDAWFQYVASQVNHKTMKDLHGLDVSLIRLDHHKLPAGDIGRVKALQSGAFVSAWQHAKFDKTKQPICQLCLVPDTQKHWLSCPRFAAQRLDSGDLHTWLSSAPECVSLHLLMPRSPHLVSLKCYFMNLPDQSGTFLSSPRTGLVNQVFTDGSFFKGCVPPLNRASWAVVNASTGESISYGGVPGLHQTIGRAELWAIISAVKWSVAHDTAVIIWTDSVGTHRRAQRLLAAPDELAFEGENADLWAKLADVFSQTSEGQIDLRWIPSHVDQTLCEPPLEEFLATWNDVVDQHAVQCNRHRGSSFDRLFEMAERYYTTWDTRLRQLRSFYLKVAQLRQEAPDIIDLTAEHDDLAASIFDTSLGDALPVSWQQILRHHEARFTCPCEFILFLIQSCIDQEPEQLRFEAVSFVELAMWVVQDLGAQFPTEKTIDGIWHFLQVSDMLLRPTLAFLTQRIRTAFSEGLTALGLESLICKGFSRQQAGIAIPIDGVYLSVSSAFSSRLCSTASSFFGPRMLRKAADLAKPSSNGFSISSTTFKGFVDSDGTEMCLEPVGQQERPALANFRPRRTLLSMRTTHVVQPFLSKMWAHRQLMSAELSVKQLSLAANELWLFHGTRESAAECITENEFQVKMAGSNRGTMFGPGIYLADSVTKSDEYTDPDPTGLRTMILCRCTMGRAVRQEGGGRECMKVCQAGGFHSVKGRRAYNEYIVYDENQVYPEYIIWYRRVYNIE